VAQVAHRGEDGFSVLFRPVHRPPFSCLMWHIFYQPAARPFAVSWS
jgi:hypothetical protein